MTKRLNIRIGEIGENVACQFLLSKGYSILGRNYRKSYGEIDIIAKKRNSIRFVEVKTVSRLPVAQDTAQAGENISSSNIEEYRPEEQVHPKKLEKIARVAAVYMNERNINSDYQIDVVGVLLDESAKIAKCRLFEGVS